MLNLIVAPLSQCDKGEDYCKRIVKHLKTEKVEYSVYFSPNMEAVSTNAEELTKEGETDFVIIGDDIVLHTFLNSVKDISKIKLGLVPVGVADFAQYLGANSNPVQAIKDVLLGNVEEIDYLKVNNKIVINNLVIGASTEIYELYSHKKIKNALTKKMLRSRYGNSFSGTNLVLDIKAENKQPAEENVFELCIANGGKSKGKTISPLSNVKDGLFNLSYITLGEVEERGKYITQFESGQQIYNEHTRQKWLTSMRITSPSGKIKTLLDGEIVELENLTVNIVCGGLKILKAQI